MTRSLTAHLTWRSRRFLAVAQGLVLLAASAAFASPFPSWSPPGKNVALKKPYTVETLGKTRPYGGTQDSGDATQLTDGVYVGDVRVFWLDKKAVGWERGPVSITIDLGETQTIGGLSYSTASGPSSGVGWPPSILILASEDGKDYHAVGELVGLSAKFGPPAGGRHRYVTDALQVRCRYVRLATLGSLYIFCDEIEVYAAPKGVEGAPPAEFGPAIADARRHVLENGTTLAVAARVATDAAHIAATIAGFEQLDEATRKRFLDRLDKLRDNVWPPAPVEDSRRFRAVAPLNDAHAAVYAVLGDAARAAGYAPVTVWWKNRWLRQSPLELPPKVEGVEPVALHVRLMKGERRSEIVNIGNFTGAARVAKVRFIDLPGGERPAYLDVRQVEYVAMQSRPWDADALPLANAANGVWEVALPAGLSRQIWFDFRLDRGGCPAGRHEGRVELALDDGTKTVVPLTLDVANSDMPPPRDRAVAIGCWDYTDQNGWGILTTSNVPAAVAHMRDSGVTAPWSRAGGRGALFPHPGAAEFDEEGRLVKEPDYSAFDQWVSMWPDAKLYMIYANGWGYFGRDPGAEKASQTELDEDQRRMGEVMKAWAAHMRKIGVDPARIALCLFDEPQFGSQARIIHYWGRAIKAAVPEFKLYEDTRIKPPYYENPDVLNMLDIMDIITPGTDYDYQRLGQQAVDFYEKLRQKGKTMGFYACAQNPSEAESTRYYRLQQWECWRINKGGSQSWAGFWSYSDNRGASPWNQIPGGAGRNWCITYVDDTSVTDGKHWLAIFEGAQDYEYLLILKNKLEAARKSGREDEAVEMAQTLLDTLPAEVVEAVRGGDMTACDAGRLKVLDAIASLD